MSREEELVREFQRLFIEEADGDPDELEDYTSFIRHAMERSTILPSNENMCDLYSNGRLLEGKRRIEDLAKRLVLEHMEEITNFYKPTVGQRKALERIAIYSVSEYLKHVNDAILYSMACLCKVIVDGTLDEKRRVTKGSQPEGVRKQHK